MNVYDISNKVSDIIYKMSLWLVDESIDSYYEIILNLINDEDVIKHLHS